MAEEAEDTVENAVNPLLTTRQKVDQLIDAMREMPRGELAPEIRDVVEMVDIVRGLTNRDPLQMILPNSDAELDLFLDKTIALLLQVRGDDLPPFDFARYGELLA